MIVIYIHIPWQQYQRSTNGLMQCGGTSCTIHHVFEKTCPSILLVKSAFVNPFVATYNPFQPFLTVLSCL